MSPAFVPSDDRIREESALAWASTVAHFLHFGVDASGVTGSGCGGVIRGTFTLCGMESTFLVVILGVPA